MKDNSAMSKARAQYSDFVLKRETTGCFLALHEKRQGPRNTTYPVVDFLSSRLPAQLASQRPFNCKEPLPKKIS